MTQLKSNLTLVPTQPIRLEIRVGCIEIRMTAPDAELACRTLHKKYGFEFFVVNKAAGITLNTRIAKGLGRGGFRYADAIERTKALAFTRLERTTTK